MTNRKSTKSFSMSLRWAAGASRRKSNRFHLKIDFTQIKIKSNQVCYKFICVKTFRDRVIRHSLAYLIVHKLLVWDVPFYLKFSTKMTYPCKNGDFQSISACITSAVTHSENSLIITNIGSPLWAFQRAYDKQRTLPLASKGGSKCKVTVFVSNLNNAITSKRCEIWCKLVLITNRKSHIDFRFVLKSVTLNNLERCNNPYFALFYGIQ